MYCRAVCAAVRLWIGGAVSPSGPAIGVICIPVGCLSGALYDGTINLGSVDPGSLILSVCRNGSLRQNAAPKRQHRSLRRTNCAAAPGQRLARFQRDPARLWTYVFGRPELLIDGDVYEISLASASMTLFRIPPKSAVYLRDPQQDPNCAAQCVHVNL